MRRALVVGVIVMLAILIVGAPGTAAVGPQEPGAPLPGITARLVLPAKTMKAGAQMTATVVIVNATGAEARVSACYTWFSVALANAQYQPEVGWLLCGGTVVIPAGTTRSPAAVAASFLSCSRSGEGDRLCGPDGNPPPLPPGKYEARFYQSSTVVPDPKPVKVRVTR
jgi:hypothetical protein